jgi:ankyrin repeat protein
MFSAAREGNFGAVKTLLEAGGNPNLNNGELVKPEEDSAPVEDDEESIQERYFMEAFKNSMTPLHVASVLGYEEIALYLVENGADVNLKSKLLGYTAMHLAVLANKPELLMELLTKTAADPMVEDNSGRTLLDMVYHFIPSYVEPF